MCFVKKFLEKLKKDEVKNEATEVKKSVSVEGGKSGAVITIAREFGSGGREIALKVSQKLNYKFYDKEEIIKVAKENGIDTKLFMQVDEKKMDSFWFNVSPMAYDIPGDEDSFEQKICNDKMFMIQSDAIRSIAEKENAVFVGRCASYILKNSAKKVFITAELDDKVERIRKRYKLSKDEAKKLIETADKKREKYYDYYTNSKWNDVNNYDLVVDVSKLGIDGAVEKIVELVKGDN